MRREKNFLSLWVDEQRKKKTDPFSGGGEEGGVGGGFSLFDLPERGIAFIVKVLGRELSQEISLHANDDETNLETSSVKGETKKKEASQERGKMGCRKFDRPGRCQ